MSIPLPNVRKLFRSWFTARKPATFRRRKPGIRLFLETLEDRLVPVTGAAQISLDVGPITPAATIQSSPTNTIPVFIDFDNQTAAGTIMGNDTVSFPSTASNVITRVGAGGSVTFSYAGANATAFNLNSAATSANLQTNLRTIPGLSAVTVTGSAGGPFTVNSLPGGGGTSLLTIATGGTFGTITSSNTFSYKGSAAPTPFSYVNYDTVTYTTAGTATFSYNGVAATSAFNSSGTAAQLLSNLQTIPSLTAAGNVTVAGNAGGPFTVIFSFGAGVTGDKLTASNGTGVANINSTNVSSATTFATYLATVPGLSGAAIVGVSGNGSAATPFAINFGSGIQGGSLLTSPNAGITIVGGSLSSATFYILYDPAVLTINQTSASVGTDIKKGALITNSTLGYTVQNAAVVASGVIGIGITHAPTSPFLATGATGHLIEIDFHVVQTASVGISTLLDLQSSLGGGNVSVVGDRNNNHYNFTTTPQSYATQNTLSSLTRPGALPPSSFPNETDTTDASIQVVAGAPLTPHGVADTLSMAPNQSPFSDTMTVSGLNNGVLANDNDVSISTATSTGTAVTITTATPQNFLVGQNVTIAGVPAPSTGTYDGTFAIASVISSTQFTYTGSTSNMTSETGGTATTPLNALLTGSGVIAKPLVPISKGFTSAAEVGNLVTITTNAPTNLVPGAGVTLSNTGLTYTVATAVTNAAGNTVLTIIDPTPGPASPFLNGLSGTISSVATTVYTETLSHGTLSLNALDGSVAFTAEQGYFGTDTFTYKAVDALSNTAGPNTKVTIYMGGSLYIPTVSTATVSVLGDPTQIGVGDIITVAVNIINPNPVNSGGLAEADFGLNYDSSVLAVATDPGSGAALISPGSVNTAAGWTAFTANAKVAGQIIITTGDSGGHAPIQSTVGGSLALIQFQVLALPPASNTDQTSLINISDNIPLPSVLDVDNFGNSTQLPFAFAPADNTDFNSQPGPTDGVVQFPVATTATTTTVSATVGGTSQSTITYGTQVTLTATVTPTGGGPAPTAGSVDFQDGSSDIGTNTTYTTDANGNGIFSLVTSVNQFEVTLAGGNPTVHTITATYTPGTGFATSSATLTNGLTITPAPLTITATADTKTYDSKTTSAGQATVSGLFGSDTVTGLVEAFANTKAGTGRTLSVTNFTLNDGNAGKDYTVTTVVNTAGVITPANLTITAKTNTKTYTATTAAGATPTVSGLIGSDTVTGLAEQYADANVATGKTISVSAYTIGDSNGGNNYSVTTMPATDGQITPAPLTITAITNTKPADGGTSAAATPTVSGLLGSDTTSNLHEVYSDPTAGSNKLLSVITYTINDNNGGNNYSVATQTDSTGVITQSANQATSTTVSANFGGAAVPTVVYGSLVTLIATISPTSGSGAAPSAGSVDFEDGGAELGTVSTETSNGSNAFFTLVISNLNLLQVIAGGAHSLTATYTAGSGFAGSSGSANLGVTPAPLTITALTFTKTYDAGTTAGVTPSVNGLIGTDSVSGQSESYANANAGASKTLAVNGGYTVNDNNGGKDYTVTTVTNTTGSITKANLIITAVTNAKTYDATTAATAAAVPTVTGLKGTDTVNATEVFADANAGSNKVLSISTYSVGDGNGGNNYAVTTVTNTTGSITKANLTITAVTNAKTYDATTAATAAAVPTVTGLKGTDSVNATEVFADANVGSNKVLSISTYSVGDGNGGNNYAVTTVTNTTGSITKANLTITAVTNAKTYDATTAATAAAVPTVTGLKGTDSVNATEVFADANAGSNKVLSISAYTVGDGNGGNNYAVTTVTNTTGSITKANLTITAVTNAKTYDATTAATAAAVPTVTGLKGTDSVNATEVFADANAGSNKVLSISAYTVGDGNGGNNYAVTTVTNTTGSITKANLTITAVTNAKTYDATTAATAAAVPTVTGLKGTDSVNATEVFADANAGSNKVLSISAYTVGDGNGGNNYAVTTVTNTTGSITKANLTITAVTNAKTYDATTAATAAAVPTVTGLKGTDTVNATEVFADANAGSSKVLSISTYSIGDGNGGNNYTVTTATNTTGSITKANLTITAITFTKGFDGGVSTTANPTVSGLKGTDSVANLAEVFSDPSAASNKTLSVSSFTVNDNNNGNNYTVSTVDDHTGLIINGSTFTTTTVATSLTPVVYGNSVTFTITVSANSGSLSPTGSVEVFSDGTDLGPATFGSSAGTNSTWGLSTLARTLIVGTHTITANYAASGNFVNSAGTLQGGQTVKPRPLTVTAVSNTKFYDATTTAGNTPTVSGLVTGDTVSNLAEVYADDNAGSSKVLSVSAYTVGDGNGGNNYTVTTATNTTGVINAAALTITATVNSKTYDATPTAGATPTVSGLHGTDTVSATEVYTDANAGSSKILSVSSFIVHDNNNGNNYTVTTAVNSSSIITKANLTITALTNAKTYDSTSAAAAVPTVSGLLGSDAATGLTEVYKDVNAGSSKILSVSAFTITDGAGGNNYSVTTFTNTAGTISKAPLTITALPNTKIFDGNTSSAVTPTVSGLFGGDHVNGLAEVYSDATVATGKTLSLSSYTVIDGNSGNNYAVIPINSTQGVINPAAGKSLISLDIGAGVTAVTAARSGIVQVFIDFDNNSVSGTSVGSNGSVASGSFYVVYDPTVLSISESSSSVGSDIKLGSLLSTTASSYNLVPAAGFTSGVVAIGLNHQAGQSFAPAALTGHLLELDFHVVSTTALGFSSLVDLQSSFTDAGGNVVNTNVHDAGNLPYAFVSPVPTQYAGLSTLSTLTQAGTLTPAQFNPTDGDPTDVAIQIQAHGPNLAPIGQPDTLNMAPNTSAFTSTMTGTGLTNGVLANDTATANGPMIAVLTGSGVTSTPLAPQSIGIVSVTETGNVVTITTSASFNFLPSDVVTIAGVQNTLYNGKFAVATISPQSQSFTYLLPDAAATSNLPSSSGGTASTIATTIYTQTTTHGHVWLNSVDGSYAFTPTFGYVGIDSFTYQAVDAVSNTPDNDPTVSVNIGGLLEIPQNLLPSGNIVVVPVNIISPNPSGSGGLTNATIGINYDTSKLTLLHGGSDVTEGTVNTGAGWSDFVVNASTPGQIIITTSDINGHSHILSTTTGSLALITFTLVGTPTGTSVVNISSSSPTSTVLDVAGTSGSGSVVLPFAIAPVDDTAFNGLPGFTDGLVTFPSATNTTTTVTAAVGGSSVSTVTYGTLVTLKATVAPSSGSFAPTAGSVDFKDGAADLGVVSSEAVNGSNAVFTLITTANQMQVIQANGGVHTITAAYSANGFFNASTGTLAGGLAVTKASLTITATANAKTYDSTTTAAAAPTVSGLIGSDTVTAPTEVYVDANAGTSKVLSVSAYTIQDTNGGNNYTVTTVNSTAGVITKANLTVTAATSTKTYDSTTTATAAPSVTGLIGGDTVTGATEVFSDANAGSGKTLSISVLTLVDGNSGNNYQITTVANASGTILKAPLTITALTNTKSFDTTTSAAAVPTVSGLVGNDSATSLTEVYSDSALGTGKTLSVSHYSINDNNGGNNYSVAKATDTTGAIVVGSFSKYVVSLLGSTPIVAGSNFTFTVTATDSFGNPVANYAGPANITISTSPTDTFGGTFPFTGTLPANGVNGFVGNLQKANASYTIQVSSGGGTFTGSSGTFAVVPASASYFTVTSPTTSATTGLPVNITVTAFDHYGNIATGYAGTVKFTSSDGAAFLGSNYTFTTTGLTPDNGTHTFSSILTLNTPGNQTIRAIDTVSTSPTVTGVTSIATYGLVVSGFTPTTSGFTATFSKPFLSNDLTLYALNNTTIQDVTLHGATVGPVHGSLLIDPANQSITFSATSSYLGELNGAFPVNGITDSAVLPDDTYTATLVSGTGSNGFLDSLLQHLDGGANFGHANYTTTFSTHFQQNANPSLSIGDFARGPGGYTVTNASEDLSKNVTITTSAATNIKVGSIVVVSGVTPVGYNNTYTVQIAAGNKLTLTSPTTPSGLGALTQAGLLYQTIQTPNGGSDGIPVTIFNAVGLSEATFTLTYNPSLLTIAGTLSGPGSDATDSAATLTLIGNNIINSTDGVATFQYQDSGALSGKVTLGDISAFVPNSAANLYQEKESLQIGIIDVNGSGTTNVVSANTVHVNAYLADVSGDGLVDGLDTITANLVAIGPDTGFSAYQLLDPVIIGAAANDLSVQAGDVQAINNYTALLNPLQIPRPPGISVHSPNAADPTLSLATLAGSAASQNATGTQTVSVLLDHPHPEGSTGITEATVALTYDPKSLRLSPDDVTLGSLVSAGNGWELSTVIDDTTGHIGIRLYSLTPITAAQAGSLVSITFHTVSGQPASTATVQLVNAVTSGGEFFYTTLADMQGALVLSPGLDTVLLSSGAPALVPPTHSETDGIHDSGASQADPRTGSAEFASGGHPFDINGETALAALSNGTVVGESNAAHTLPVSLIVSGLLAFQSNTNGSAIPWSGQFIQITSLVQPNVLLANNIPPAQTNDRWFQIWAQKSDTSAGFDAASPFLDNAIWDAAPGLDWLNLPLPTPEPVTPLLPMDGTMDQEMGQVSERVSVLDKLFADLGDEMDDFSDLSGN